MPVRANGKVMILDSDLEAARGKYLILKIAVDDEAQATGVSVTIIKKDMEA